MSTKMTLRDAPLGSDLVLSACVIPDLVRHRLLTLGLRPGVELKVTGKTVGGGRVARIGETRVALGAQLCRQLRVEKLEA